MPAFFLTVILLIICSATVQARVIHVPGDSTTIQGGINSASTGDTVMVAPGTYYEYAIDFLGKAITVRSTDPEDSAVVASTVVDGDSLGRVFIFQSSEGSLSVLTGLSITNGSSDRGGGIFCIDSSPTISNNIIRNNTAIGSISPDGQGGGIFCIDSSPLIKANLIISNSADRKGGGIKVTRGSPLIINNRMKENSAGIAGGAVRTYTSSTKIISNLIVNNWAGYHGGGISTHKSSSTVIENNTIIENSVDYSGGGGGITSTDDAQVTNCILWGNSPWQIDLSPVVTYSDIQGGASGVGNIDQDPLFVDAANGNYHLQPLSPCVDAGSPSILDACLPPGLGEERSDMGAYGGEENCGWEPLPYGIYLSFWPDGAVDIPREGVLEFSTRILNYRENIVEGDYWLLVLLPNAVEYLIPDQLLNYGNPLSGQIFPFGVVDLSNQLFIPAVADTGSYSLIGRVGRYPDTIIDEESFGFQVVE
jgi:hypothetical protein